VRRKFHVHSEGHAAAKKKPVGKFSGTGAQGHHSSTQSTVPVQLKLPIVSSGLKRAGRGRAAWRLLEREHEMNKLLSGMEVMQLSAGGGGNSVDDVANDMGRLDIRMNKFRFDAEGVAHVQGILDSQGNLELGGCLDLMYKVLTGQHSLSDNANRLLTESIDDIITKSSNPDAELSPQTIRMCEFANRLNQARLTSNAISRSSNSSSGSSSSSDDGSNALGQRGGMISRTASSNSQDSGGSDAAEVFWQGDASGGVSWGAAGDDSSDGDESPQVDHLGWDL